MTRKRDKSVRGFGKGDLRDAGTIDPEKRNRPPEFDLHVTPDQTLSLSELRGRPVVLVFYPADWSPVCGDELAIYNELLSEFQKHDAEVLGVSVDGSWCHAAFASARKLHFPLLSDFEPKGEAARRYGAYRQKEGVCERALFVLDRGGTVYWSFCSPIGVNPGADGVLQALEELTNKSRGGGEDDEPKDSSDGRRPLPRTA